MLATDHISNLERALSEFAFIQRIDSDIDIDVSGRDSLSIRLKMYFSGAHVVNYRERVDTHNSYAIPTDYSYQLMHGDQQIFRYDCAPHHPHLDGFPYHKHIGADEDHDIRPSDRLGLRELLREVNELILASEAQE